MPRKHIPTEIDLGCANIHVKLVSKKYMKDELGDDIELGADEYVDGMWDVDHDTILIGKWLPRKRQYWVLLHELIHAVIDLRDRYDKD